MDPAIIKWSPQRIIRHRLFYLLSYVYVSNNPLNRFDPDGFTDCPTFRRGFYQVGEGALGLGITFYALGESGGALSIFGATLVSTSIISNSATLVLGLMDILISFQNRSSVLPDGIIVKMLVATGMKRKNAIKFATLYDTIEMMGDISEVGKKTGTLLDQLKSLLSAKDVTGDIKKWVEEKIKELEQEEQKSKEEKQKRRKEQKEKEEKTGQDD